MSGTAEPDSPSRVDRLLNQDEVWTAERGNLLIADMDIDHVQRLIPWLERRAESLAHGYFLAFTLGTPPGDSYDDVWGAFQSEMEGAFKDPVRWLHTTALVRRLDQILADALADAEDAAS